MTFRFNRDKRFGDFSYAEFMDAARKLIALVREKRPSCTAEILTYESTGAARRYPRADLHGDAAMETSDYIAYPIERFGEDDWKRIVDAQVRIEDPNDAQPFVITMTCSRRPRTNRVYFWGQLVEEPLFGMLYAEFARPSATISIGDEVDRNSIIGTRQPKRVA